MFSKIFSQTNPSGRVARLSRSRFTMGRGRRGGPSSDDESDDGGSPAGGASSQQLGKGKGGGNKKYIPGMSGADQKKRAKEQRLEQERRKAERDKRNEDKRVTRLELEEETAEAVAVPLPKPSSKRRQKEDDGVGGSFPPQLGGTPPHHQASAHHGNTTQHHTHADAYQIRRDLRRLFGRIEHGGGFFTSGASSQRAIAVGDVFVTATSAAIGDRRKSGADAWSARVQKGNEMEMPLGAFLASSSEQLAETESEHRDKEPPYHGEDRDKEPPYHRVRRVVARWSLGDGETVEEILWDARSVVVDDTVARLGNTHLSGSPRHLSGSPRHVSGSPDTFGSLGGSPGTDGHRELFGVKHKTYDALSLLSKHCWEDVFSFCDARGVVRLGATCASLAEIARSQAVRQQQHVAMFGRPAPVAPLRAPLTQARPSAPPAAPVSPAALEQAAAKKGWAATCASFLAADAWIPRRRLVSGFGSDDDDDDDDEERDDEQGVEFDDDDDDFAVSSGAYTRAGAPHDTSTARVAVFASPSIPRPNAKHTGIGPHSAHHLLANAATAVSCDGSKIKLWFHGGDGLTESGKRIATLPNPAGSKPWTSLTASLGLFVAGDAYGALTVWDADALEVRHARVPGVVRWDAVEVNEPLSALATVPTSGLVASSSGKVSVVRLIDVTPELGGAPVVLADVDVQHRGDEFEEFNRQGVDALVVAGAGDAYRDAGGVRTFNPNGHAGASAPKLWAACSRESQGLSSLSTDEYVSFNHQLVAVDLETCVPTERFEVPSHADGHNYGQSAALATHGDLVVFARDGAATMWDTRLASSSSSDPVAVFVDDAEIRLTDEGSRGHVAVDDWAVWVSRAGGDGVRLYDIRRVSGPPRGRERWHRGDSVTSPPVAIYSAGVSQNNTQFKSVRVGAFARGGDGALVVAPACCEIEVGGDRESSVRCSVFTSGHFGETHTRGGWENDRGIGAEPWGDGFAKPSSCKKKKNAKPKAKKYPKRQGGKFRARTAGG